MVVGKLKFFLMSFGVLELFLGMILILWVGIKLKFLINFFVVRVGKFVDEENDKGLFVIGLEFEGVK